MMMIVAEKIVRRAWAIIVKTMESVSYTVPLVVTRKYREVVVVMQCEAQRGGNRRTTNKRGEKRERSREGEEKRIKKEEEGVTVSAPVGKDGKKT